MSALLTTYSKFYYGYVIDDTNFILNFDEGGPELAANLNIGEYTFEGFAEEIERALNDAGALTYTVSVDRSLRVLTVAASGTFSLLVATGTSIGNSPFILMGFTVSDRTGASTYTGNLPSGYEYRPQFMIQSFISSDDWQEASEASVNKTANGLVEIVKFGQQKFLQMQFRFITDIDQGSSGPIKTDLQGLDNTRQFLQYITKRIPVDFMPDVDTSSTFQIVVFESSQDSQTGTGYKLKELYDKNLPGYFETAVMKFRLRE